MRRAPASLGMSARLPLTCRGPRLDVPRAVDHSVLGLPFFHGTKAVPKERAFVSWLSAPGGHRRPLCRLSHRGQACLVGLDVAFPAACSPSCKAAPSFPLPPRAALRRVPHACPCAQPLSRSCCPWLAALRPSPSTAPDPCQKSLLT